MFEQESKEHQQQRQESQRLLAALRQGRVSRRDFVVRAAALGFSGAAINVFLIACSGGTPVTTAPAASAAPASTSATTAASSDPSASAALGTRPAPGGVSTATRPAGSAVAGTATRAATSAAGTPVVGNSSTKIPTAQGTQLGGEIPTNAQLSDKQELRYPFSELVHPDPGQATAVQEVQFILNCWDSLVTANQQGDPKPAHATKYDVSADGLSYTFTLRPGLKFSDGSPLTAKDYEWTWKRNLSPDTASEYAQALYPIKGAEDYSNGKTTDPTTVGVKATTDTTLVVNLIEPAPYFLALVSTWMYVPLQQATIEKNKEKWVEAGNMVTAGKYRLQEWAHDQRMVIVADPNYYGDKPSLQQITFSIVSKKEFRQAVYYAINRDNLCNNVLKGQYLPKTTFVPKGILGYLEQPPMPVDFKGDKTKAKQLLQTAGYSGQELVYTHSDTVSAKAISQALQADLKEVGINIRLDQLARKAFAAWRESRKDQAFDMYVGAWFSDYEDPNNWYNFFLANPDQEFWHCHYPQLESGKSFIDLIRKSNVLQDRAQRQAGYEQAEKQLLTDLPFVPLYNNADVVLVKPYVKGLVHTSLGQDLFGGVKILKR